jgi:hypothetical protein
MKKELSVLDIESQVAVELPERELLALVHIGNITITVRNVNIAAQICAALLIAGVSCVVEQ